MSSSQHARVVPATPAWSRLLTVLTWVLLGVSVTLLFLMSLNRFFDHDEFEAMHTTWKMFSGQAIYTDFIQHHHPFTYYTLLPLYTFFGGTTEVLIAARIVIFVFLAAMLTLTYLIAWEVYQKHLTAVLGTLFLSFISLFTAKAIEIRPDVPQALLGLLGAYLVSPFFSDAGALAFAHQPAWVGLRRVDPCTCKRASFFAGLVGLVLLGRWLFGRRNQVQ